jgi:TPR repeat protein
LGKSKEKLEIESMPEPNLKLGLAAFANQDYSQAWELLLPFALYGQAEAQCFIASMYHWGLGRPADLPKAIEWYRQAAHQNYGIAANNLAAILAQGYDNTPPDPEAADSFYAKAQEQGWQHAPQALIDLSVGRAASEAVV